MEQQPGEWTSKEWGPFGLTYGPLGFSFCFELVLGFFLTYNRERANKFYLVCRLGGVVKLLSLMVGKVECGVMYMPPMLLTWKGAVAADKHNSDSANA